MEYVEIKYQDPATKCYLGSPSITRLDNGDLVVTHDYFGPGCPLNHEGEEHLTSVYRSRDDGLSWHNVTHIAGAFWSNLFTHRGALYLLGTSQRHGSIVIRRSDDGGYTWTHPRDERTGLLYRGGPYRQAPNYHCVPMPVLAHGGRLYRAFEDCDPCEWPQGFRSCVISADGDADLLDSASWTMSNKLSFAPAWAEAAPGAEWGARPEKPGWLEGNLIAGPDGALWNMLRFHSSPLVDLAAMVAVSEDGKRLCFDPASGFVRFPGGMTKFTVRYDPVTGFYLTLSNPNTRSDWPSQRNVLALFVSRNLYDWRHVQTLLEDDSGLASDESLRQTGFQYVDWQFDGDDLLYVVRMAYRGAHNYHDANRITFHCLTGFRAAIRV